MLTYAAQYICSHCKLCLLSWQSIFPSMWLWSSSEQSSNPAFYNVIKITLCFFSCLFLLRNYRQLWNCVIFLLKKIAPLSLPLSLSQLFILSLRGEWLNKEKNLILSLSFSHPSTSFSVSHSGVFTVIVWLCCCFIWLKLLLCLEVILYEGRYVSKSCARFASSCHFCVSYSQLVFAVLTVSASDSRLMPFNLSWCIIAFCTEPELMSCKA